MFRLISFFLQFAGSIKNFLFQRGFYEACIYGNEEVVKYFLNNKKLYQIDIEWVCLEENKFYPFTAIELAVITKQIKIAQLLFPHTNKYDNVSILNNLFKAVNARNVLS